MNGVLTQLDFERPSEVRVLAGLPFEAVKAGVDAISQVLQLRVNIEDQTKKIATLEAELATLRATSSPKDTVAIAEKEKALLELRKQILTLEKEIDALEATGSGE